MTLHAKLFLPKNESVQGKDCVSWVVLYTASYLPLMLNTCSMRNLPRGSMKLEFWSTHWKWVKKMEWELWQVWSGEPDWQAQLSELKLVMSLSLSQSVIPSLTACIDSSDVIKGRFPEKILQYIGCHSRKCIFVAFRKDEHHRYWHCGACSLAVRSFIRIISHSLGFSWNLEIILKCLKSNASQEWWIIIKHACFLLTCY